MLLLNPALPDLVGCDGTRMIGALTQVPLRGPALAGARLRARPRGRLVRGGRLVKEAMRGVMRTTGLHNLAHIYIDR